MVAVHLEYPALYFSTSRSAVDRPTAIGHFVTLIHERETATYERERQGAPDHVTAAITACGMTIDVTPATFQQVERCKLCAKRKLKDDFVCIGRITVIDSSYQRLDEAVQFKKDMAAREKIREAARKEYQRKLRAEARARRGLDPEPEPLPLPPPDGEQLTII